MAERPAAYHLVTTALPSDARLQQPQPHLQHLHHPTANEIDSRMAQFWESEQRAVEVMPAELTAFKNAELPLARIKKIMKLDDDVKSMMIAAEAPLLFSKAAEIFIRELTVRAWAHTERARRRTLQRNDIAMSVGDPDTDQFDFLIDIVPRESQQPPPPQHQQQQQQQHHHHQHNHISTGGGGKSSGEASPTIGSTVAAPPPPLPPQPPQAVTSAAPAAPVQYVIQLPMGAGGAPMGVGPGALGIIANGQVQHQQQHPPQPPLQLFINPAAAQQPAAAELAGGPDVKPNIAAVNAASAAAASVAALPTIGVVGNAVPGSNNAYTG